MNRNPTTNETRNESLVVRLAPDGSERPCTGTLPNGDPADVTATVTEGRDGAIFVVGSTTGELSVGASMGDRDAFLRSTKTAIHAMLLDSMFCVHTFLI